MKISSTSLLLPGALIISMSSVTAVGQDNVGSCAAIDNAQERLACYDRAAENASRLPVVRLPRNTQQTAPETAATPGNANAPQARQDEFGLEMKQEKQRDRGPDTRNYRVLSARHNDFTGWTIEFEGGGVWKQVGTDDYKIEVGETYTVRRGSFNSYILSNSSNNKKIRVTRVE